MAEWYYQVAGEVMGPVSLEQLKERADDGQIDEETLVREGADAEWVAASEVDGLLESSIGPADTPVPEETVEYEISTDPDPGPVPAQADAQAAGVGKSPLALRPCLDCGRMVSRLAAACPHCGRLFHESSRVVRYRGEHPVPVLVFFVVLALAFLLLGPLAVYVAAAAVASRVVEGAATASAVAVVIAILYMLSMFVCALLGRAVGAPRKASLTGLLLGLFFGPLGVFAAFAIDKRPQCCNCSSRLDGFARECPHCHARLIWKVETTWY
jgi:hypothetical protein